MLQRVEQQVVERAGKRVGVDVGVQSLAARAVQANVLSRRLLGAKGDAFPQPGAEVGRRARRRHGAREGEQRADERVDAVDRRQHGRERAAASLERCLALHGERVLGAQPHRAERVADLVGEAGGDAAEAAEPVGLRELAAEPRGVGVERLDALAPTH